jgi:hypothetical protein
MDTEPAVSYHAAVPGTPVLTTTGNEIGTLEHVLEVPGEDLFDGLVIATDWGLRFVDAGQVELITVRHVRSRLDDEQAARLAPPRGTVVYQVSSMDEIGDALDERLGLMFGRPHWTSG